MSEIVYQRQFVTQALITPDCRVNRGDEGAWNEAVRRLREEYEAIIEGWANESEQPVLVLSLHCDRPTEDHVPAIPPFFVGEEAADD